MKLRASSSSVAAASAVGLSVVALAIVGLARAAPAVQGVHGGGMLGGDFFATKYTVNVTRQPSGSLSGSITASGIVYTVYAYAPTGLSLAGDTACITGAVTKISGSFSEPPESVVLLLGEFAGEPDRIVSSFVPGETVEPPFACAALARSLLLAPLPQLVAGNFTFVGN